TNKRKKSMSSSDNSDSDENQAQKYSALHPLLMKNKVEASYTIASTPTLQKNPSLISTSTLPSVSSISTPNLQKSESLIFSQPLQKSKPMFTLNIPESLIPKNRIEYDDPYINIIDKSEENNGNQTNVSINSSQSFTNENNI